MWQKVDLVISITRLVRNFAQKTNSEFSQTLSIATHTKKLFSPHETNDEYMRSPVKSNRIWRTMYDVQSFVGALLHRHTCAELLSQSRLFSVHVLSLDFWIDSAKWIEIVAHSRMQQTDSHSNFVFNHFAIDIARDKEKNKRKLCDKHNIERNEFECTQAPSAVERHEVALTFELSLSVRQLIRHLCCAVLRENIFSQFFFFLFIYIDVESRYSNILCKLNGVWCRLQRWCIDCENQKR